MLDLYVKNLPQMIVYSVNMLGTKRLSLILTDLKPQCKDAKMTTSMSHDFVLMVLKVTGPVKSNLGFLILRCLLYLSAHTQS